MFTGNEDMEATALREQDGRSRPSPDISAATDETIRNHLNGTPVAGERRRSEPDPFEPFVPYLRERLREDPHIWATALFDEVTAPGFGLSYQSFTRGLRLHALRPHCEACGEEIQWDWDELPEAPRGGEAHPSAGSLPCSSKFRGVFAESEDQAHLIEARDCVLETSDEKRRRRHVA